MTEPMIAGDVVESEDVEKLEEMAAALEGSHDYRVLRRFQSPFLYGELTGDEGNEAERHIGLFVDVEGTGLDETADKVIQLGIVRFSFDNAGNVGQVLNTYVGLEDPGVPLDPEVAAITGLTDEQLRGQRIHDGMVGDTMKGAELVIAHHAEYDRPMLERRIPGFDRLAWACSLRQIDWRRFGSQYLGLEHILMTTCSRFSDGLHDALTDALVGLHVLAVPRAADGTTPFQELLASTRDGCVRISAWDSDYETKDILRRRRYRWNGDVRCWRKDVPRSHVASEMEWLTEHVYGDVLFNCAKVTEISARDRYSLRAKL